MESVLAQPPGIEPVTLAEAKAQTRVLHDSEDALLNAYIAAARQHAEEYTKRSLITQTWRATWDSFEGPRLYLPRPPILTVEAVAYTDYDGAEQALADYQTSLAGVRPFVTPAYGGDWPLAREIPGAVSVTYTAGYGATAESVPQAIRLAILMLVGSYYANREHVVVGHNASELPGTVKALLAPYRIMSVP